MTDDELLQARRDGMTWPQISEKFDVAPSTAGSRYYRLMKDAERALDQPQDKATWATEENLAQLRVWHAEGVSLGEMGRRLKVSNNAIIGKVRRMGLPPRPSPIKRRDPNPPPSPPRSRARKPIALTLDSVVMPETRHILNGATVPLGHQASRRDAVRGATLASVRAGPAVATLVHAGVRSCLFPLWGDTDPVPRPALYCGKEVVRGSYCAACAARCYEGTHRRDAA